MDQEIARREAAAATGEGVGLAHEMGRAYAEHVAFLRKHMRLTVEEALAQIDNPRDAAAHRERLMRSPPDQVFWLDLAQLLERDPEGAQAAWDRLKAEARAELAGGHRAAKAVEYRDRPWERARFLALRQSFRGEWQPRGGIEDALIDTLAQAHTAQLTWLARLHVQTTLEFQDEEADTLKSGHWRGPRVKDSEAVEQSAAMLDRFNRLFVRTLRTLRDLRRYAPAIHIEHAGQVNVAQGPQLNVAHKERQDLPVDLVDSLPEGALRFSTTRAVIDSGGAPEQ